MIKIDKITGIYKITNKINDKCYIGQSIDIYRRFDEHKYTSKTSKYLHNSMVKYGINNFNFEIIEECDESILSEREKYWIKFYNSIAPNGYNLTNGGDDGNTFRYRTEKEMEETKRKIRLATSGKNNGFFGKHHSEKTKEYLRKINVGKTISQETKEKLKKSLKGHYMPQEAKDKISNATKKQWKNEKFRNMMSKINIGNSYVSGNKWNIGRIDIYHKETFQHKRIFENELEQYLENGYTRGLPANDKRHNPAIKHCTFDNLIGVSFDKHNNKWRSYITFRNKRYGTKIFNDKREAILYRSYLEDIFNQIKDSQIDISLIDVKQSLEQGRVVLYCG